MCKQVSGWIIFSSCVLLSSGAQAANRDKADNTTNLNLSGSWVNGIPYSNDIAQWGSAVTAPNTVLLGADLSYRGISVFNPGGDVAIGGDNSLTLDFWGLDLNSATVDMTVTNANLILKDYSCPVWNVTGGRTLTVSPTVLTRGVNSTLGLPGAGTVASTTFANDATGLIGPWARSGTGTSTKYATVSGGNLVGYTGSAAATAADVTDTTGVVNYDVAATGTLGAGAAFNTLRYTGGSGTIPGDYMANGLLNSGSGTLTLSGDLTIGADRELVLTSPDTTRQLTLSGLISDNAGGASDIIVTGSGQVNLSASNDYSGVTVVSSGTLVISDDSALGSTEGETIVYENGSYNTGGRLTITGGIRIEEPVTMLGPGDGNPWQQGLSVGWGGGSNVLAGPITIKTSGSTRMTAGGNNSVLDFSAPITRTSGSGSLILGGGGTGGKVLVNQPIDNLGGGVNLHSGPGTIIFNVGGHNIGDMNVQYLHVFQLGISDALSYNRSMNIGSPSSSSTPESGTFDMAGFDQTINGLNGSGNVAPTSARVVQNTSAGLSTLTVGAANGSGTFDGVITDDIALIKEGSGTETLAGTLPNTYTGATVVNGGTLSLNKTEGTNALPGSVTVGAARLNNAQSDQIPDSATVTMTDAGSSWTLNGNSETVANLDMQNANPSVNLGYVSGTAGKLTVTDTLTHMLGNITLNSSGTGGESVITANKLVNMGGDWTFGVNTGTQSLNIGAGGLTIGGGSEIFVNATVDCPSFVTLSGDVTSLANSDVNSITGAGELRLNGSRDFAVEDGDALIDMQIDAVLISGTPSGSLTKSGPGVLKLTGANAYTGGTTVAAGTLAIDDTGALPGWNTSAEYTVADGAALVAGDAVSDADIATMLGTGNFAANASMGFDTTDGDRMYTPDIVDTGAGALGVVKTGANKLTLTGANTYTGTTEINGGTLNIDDTAALPGWNTAGRYAVAGGAVLEVQNAVGDADVTTMLDTGNFLSGAGIGFDTTAGDRTHANMISNSVNGTLDVVKVGENALTLSGDNSYDGTTTLDGGKIIIKHSNALGSTNGITVINRVGGTSGNYYTDATGQLLLDGSGGDLVIDENFSINGAEQYGYGGPIRNNSGNNVINGWIELGPNGGAYRHQRWCSHPERPGPPA